MEPVGRLERLLDATARRLTGGAIHPIELLEQVATALRGGVVDGVMPNGITLELHPRDFDAYRTAVGALAVEVDALAQRVEREGGFRRVGEITVDIGESESVPAGSPGIGLRFFERAAPLVGHEPSFPTRRLRRQRGVNLILADGTRVRLTHTPFVIGRAPGSDLVLPSMAVSRQHAEIVEVEGAFVIRDLGGRNGVLVSGARVESASLDWGSVIQLGDVTLWIEPADD